MAHMYPTSLVPGAMTTTHDATSATTVPTKALDPTRGCALQALSADCVQTALVISMYDVIGSYDGGDDDNFMAGIDLDAILQGARESYEAACTCTHNTNQISWTGERELHDTTAAIDWASSAELRDVSASLAVPFDACYPLRSTVSGGIVVLERGVCSFSRKAHNAQQAGARGVLIVNSASQAMLWNFHSDENEEAASVTIPVTMIEREPGLRLVDAIRAGSSPRIRFGEPAAVHN